MRTTPRGGLENLDHPTLCSDWTVRQLAAHVATGPAGSSRCGAA
ncbi:maleylpyruvate isomerase N-terminal domain-containing protein [Nocardioides hwasunensis]